MSKIFCQTEDAMVRIVAALVVRGIIFEARKDGADEWVIELKGGH